MSAVDDAITVIIATYKRPHLIERALDSVAAQTLQPHEVIVVDDASDDESGGVVAAWADRHSLPVRFIQAAQNGGAGVARNLAMEVATTPLIAFLDSDDAYLPHALEQLAAPLRDLPDLVVSFADAELRWADGRPSAHMMRRCLVSGRDTIPLPINPAWEELKDPQSALLLTSMIPTCAALFRLDAAKTVGLMPDYRHGEDWIFWLKLTQMGRFVAQYDDVAIVNRQDDNLTGAQHDARTARLTLNAFLKLRDGQFNIPLTHANRARLNQAIIGKAADLRYHTSRKGLSFYWQSLGSPEARRIAPRWRQLLSDPKSFVRACRFSFPSPNQVTP